MCEESTSIHALGSYDVLDLALGGFVKYEDVSGIGKQLPVVVCFFGGLKYATFSFNTMNMGECAHGDLDDRGGG